MSPIGNMIIIGAIAFGMSVGAYRLIYRSPRQRRRVITRIIDPAHSGSVVGDGAWMATKAEFPKSARARDIEPRGL